MADLIVAPTSWPTSIDTATTLQDHADIVRARHVNNVISAILSLETVVGVSKIRQVLFTDGSGNILGVTLGDGEVLIGRAGNTPINNTLTGTANRVIITNASGSITLSLPQDIHTGASPTFVGLTLTGLANGIIRDAAGVLSAAELSGDVTTSGSNVVTLANSGVSAGTYTKVTVDAKGRVTVGATAVLASADFANQGTTTTVLHGNAAGNPSFGAVVEGDQTLADVTTNNVTSTKHGYAPKSPGSAAQYLNGAATPAYTGITLTTDALDYSETSFTPALAFGGSSTGITYGTQIGRSIKIGNLVNFTISIVLTSKGAQTGAATITGLPVASINLAGYKAACAIYFTAGATLTTNMLMATIPSNSTVISLFDLAAASAAALDNTDFTNTTEIVISGKYRV